MGYKESLEAAGAKVIAFDYFGSYQGDWAAFVEYNNEKVIILGSYGSCSGCDAFQSEFDYCDFIIDNGVYYYNYKEIKEGEYLDEKEAFLKKLADFGKYYLKNPSTKEIIQTRIDNLDKDDYFDTETKEVLDWCIKKFNTEDSDKSKLVNTTGNTSLVYESDINIVKDYMADQKVVFGINDGEVLRQLEAFALWVVCKRIKMPE